MIKSVRIYPSYAHQEKNYIIIGIAIAIKYINKLENSQNIVLRVFQFIKQFLERGVILSTIKGIPRNEVFFFI